MSLWRGMRCKRLSDRKARRCLVSVGVYFVVLIMGGGGVTCFFLGMRQSSSFWTGEKMVRSSAQGPLGNFLSILSGFWGVKPTRP